MTKMKIDTRDIVSVTDVNAKGVSWLINEALGGRTIGVMKSNKLAAVVVGTAVMEKIEVLDEREENLRLWSAAIARMALDNSGPPIIDIHAHVTMTRPDEAAEGTSDAAELMLAAAAEFGIDLDALTDDAPDEIDDPSEDEAAH